MKKVNLNKILEFEEEYKLFDFKTSSGEKIWSLIRYQYIQSILEFYNKFDSAQITKPKKKIVEKIKYIIKTIYYNPLRLNFGKKKYLYLATATYDEIAGKNYNRITEPYAELFPDDSILVEESYNLTYGTPRTFQSVSFIDYFLVFSRIKGLITGVSDVESRAIDDLLAILKEKGPYTLSEPKWIELLKYLEKQLSRRRYLKYYYRCLFEKIAPEVIFIEGACYGNRVHIVEEAKQLGIKTVEIQHGFIGRSHPAYNYILNDEKDYIQHCPDFLLTYGEYWGEAVSVPCKTVAVGNPLLNRAVQNGENKAVGSFRVLVISSGVDFLGINELLTSYLLSDINDVDNVEFIFRPHPLEKPMLAERYQGLFDLGVKVSDSELYEDVALCSIVIGDFSTVLYEALAFNKPVFLIDNDYAKQYIQSSDILNQLNRVRDKYDLNNAISNKGENISQILSGKIWAKSWNENVQKFFSSIQ